MIEFATWVFALGMCCTVASGFLFIIAPAERVAFWAGLGALTGLAAVALGGVLAIMGLYGIIRFVALALGF